MCGFETLSRHHTTNREETGRCGDRHITAMPDWLIIALGYLLGSIPTAYLAGRLRGGRDIRHLGDTNTGAANAYRELGAATGVAVFAGDLAKGAAAVLIARASHGPQGVLMLTGLAAVIGHNWPVYLGFHGGRGVSTTIGVLAVFAPLPVLIVTLPTVLIIAWKHNVTLAMAFAYIGFFLIAWWRHVDPAVIWYGIGLAVLVGITTFFRLRGRSLREARHASER
jgi:glycerol-3-phosphate acyltransferase PlsY